MSDHLNLQSRSDLERACEVLASMGAPHLPLMRAAASGQIALVNITDPAAQWPEQLLAGFNRPVVVLLGDDLEPSRPSTLPPGWACAPMLRSWAVTAFVHGAAGETMHYRGAVAAALMCGRVAFVETASRCVRPWANFLKPMPVMAFLPRDGVHPVPLRKGGVH